MRIKRKKEKRTELLDRDVGILKKKKRVINERIRRGSENISRLEIINKREKKREREKQIINAAEKKESQ